MDSLINFYSISIPVSRKVNILSYFSLENPFETAMCFRFILKLFLKMDSFMLFFAQFKPFRIIVGFARVKKNRSQTNNRARRLYTFFLNLIQIDTFFKQSGRQF